MYGPNNAFPYGYYNMDNLDDNFASMTTLHPSMAINVNKMEYDTFLALKAEEVCGYSSNNNSHSGCSSSHGSCTTTYATNNNQPFLHNNVDAFSPFVSSSEISSITKIYTTDDLQEVSLVPRKHRPESPLSNEINMIVSMNRATKYTPEEKKERIERYRSKRSLRNFDKKIKYECRKTLADSRARIRGRFARNDEIEKTFQHHDSDHHASYMEYDENLLNFLNAYSANLIP